MSLEIRPIRAEELDEFIFANAYAFNDDRRAEALQQTIAVARAALPLGITLAAFLNGKLAAGLRVIPLAMRIDGAPMPLGGVAGVACLPEHRRRGYVGALLKRALNDMRDRGQVISALYTPHIELYRRYSWEIASRNIRYSFHPKEVKTVVAPAAQGRFRRVAIDDWATLNTLYEEFAATRNCVLVRSQEWWQQSVLRELRIDRAERPGVFGRDAGPDVALWENATGEPKGYVIYSTRKSEPPDRPWPQSRLWVRELVTTSSDAYVALVNYLLSHDIHDRIEWMAPPDEPIVNLIDDPHRLDVRAWSALLLRIVDVPAALRARGCPAGADGRRFTVGVRDPALPQNEGVWRVEAAGGALNVEKVDGAPDIAVDVRVLAPIFNGHLAPSEAARAGLLEVAKPSALDAASAVFTTAHPPFCMDYF